MKPFLHILFGIALLCSAPTFADDATFRIVTLGDSITKGVRGGVKPDETFSARLQVMLREKGISAEVINVGIGGERTDQALRRLDKDVIAKKPNLVTIMYGTNDSYVDKGKDVSRITAAEYKTNLGKLVDQLQAAKIKVILMTEPRWGIKAPLNGVKEHPNVRLEKYVEVCREVAREKKVPLVDNFRIWSERESAGVDIGALTTDQCHPNPQGHQLIAEAMLPIVQRELSVKSAP